MQCIPFAIPKATPSNEVSRCSRTITARSCSRHHAIPSMSLPSRERQTTRNQAKLRSFLGGGGETAVWGATYRAAASLGGPSRLSLPSRPMLLMSVSPEDLVAGSRRPAVEPAPVEMSLATSRPEPTLTLRASAEFQSDATGGCSGRGRLD
ncbi:hypothetical protein FJTKL_03681 [Diaporthe vaccinii]|uniref:Uncharacterized protein n=1 Tax=Diaporthe vaccinii TaxID=105482 RepID=A0ABR4DX62_9PEZI